MKYIVGNWKSHKSVDEARSWFEEFGGLYKRLPEVKVVVAVPSVYVFAAKKWVGEFDLEGVGLAVQDISPFPFGAYTGAVAAEMIKGAVEYAIVGHSERREYFNESNQDVANKVRQLREAGVRPIVCVDMPYAKAQMAAIDDE